MEITAAVVKAQGSEFELAKVILDQPKSDEVLVRIVATGICHTDMVARDFVMGSPNFPVILGHEGSGVIESIGEDVHHLNVGDHVVLTYGYCGECEICRSGTPAYCYEFFPRNFSGARVDGTHNHHYPDGKVINDNFFSQSSFATYAVAHKNNVIAVPKDAPLEILGPLGCGIQTGAGAVINSLKVKVGSTIVITGTGAVGLAALMAAKASSATVIIAVDINEERLNFSKELGATHTINSLTEDVQKRIREILPNGVQYGIDTTGRNEVINNVLASLAPVGEMVCIGVARKPLELETNIFLTKGYKIRWINQGDSVPQEFIPKLIHMYQLGQFPFDKLIKKYAFQDINEAVEDSEKGKTIKSVLLIGEYKQ
ncbi:NAD(P)-dependent alcohol dehydrogenase [Mucilaginibacter sp. Bleaf8]|uniref:NAD(P)-dependent alcohol dehydrogenase n=1 Tax=Mucilaginibacter sp. Bleaf8 TaxID=2834430 RepID=UPI001BCF177A|nr:NAD(P)-dependent alcohol dehydrogenase [Mucilaginibacter sp. Bleaf8]MBS7565482.1 NAD(P)-dependent alcohol dehydrogenase [Mucilaginibacter sp. Bleaf8]